MLRVGGVVVELGGRAVVDDVDVDVQAGETVAVLGPSGCGKSTLLRAIAGLEPLAAGRVEWDGRDLAGVPVHARGFGLMFQDYALFPHRDVIGNVEFGLRMTGMAKADRARRVTQVLDLTGLAGFERRRVGQLSGGEQQRVALARALAPSPRLLMLDEPLGALDRALRDTLMAELRELLDRAALPALYVTHDHEEAFTLADRIVVMRAGGIVQAGTPHGVWARPADEWISRFLGFSAGVDAEVAESVAQTPWGALPVGAGAIQGPARVVLRPDAIRLDSAGPLSGKVAASAFAGDRVVVSLDLGSGPRVEVRVSARSAPGPGDSVRVSADPDGVLTYRR